MVLVIEDENGNRTVYQSNSPAVTMQLDGVVVQVQGRETDELNAVVHAAHNQFKWLRDEQRKEVFAEFR
jgi:hypothetical protein